ncbi:MAG: hypothetical protein FWG50_13920 [Kiritimatiellaeota bacterium]|nr:hypothetical protein [Kiritimatiellota bacterium]
MTLRKLPLLVYAFVPFLVAAAEAERPPSAAAIHDTLQQLWGGKKYKATEAYVKDLQKKWPQYVPARLVQANYHNRFGSQIEDALDILTDIRRQLGQDKAWMLVSPVFIEEIDAEISRAELSSGSYLAHGPTKSERMEKRNPLRPTGFQHSREWAGDSEILYFEAPEVFLRDAGCVPAYPKEDKVRIPDLGKMDKEQIFALLCDENVDMRVKKGVVKAVVGDRAKRGAEEVAKGLGDILADYTYHETVEALAKIGKTAVSGVLEALTPESLTLREPSTIWALTRIGADSPEAIQFLEKMAADTGRSNEKSARYARDTLTRIREGNRSKKEGEEKAPLPRERGRLFR